MTVDLIVSVVEDRLSVRKVYLVDFIRLYSRAVVVKVVYVVVVVVGGGRDGGPRVG